MTSEALWAESARASSGHALGNVGVRISRIVSGLSGFRSFQRMLDLGGGHGVFALYIVNAHRDMKGTVFDRPAVVKVAESFIQEYGMADRVDVKAGDYLMDDIGEGYDLIWASATLNFAKFQVDALLQKVHDALNPGGYFLSFQDGMTHEQTRPDTMLGHMMDVLRTGADFLLDQGFVADAMLKAGFSSVRSRTLETPMGCMDLDIARKKPV
ncbi:MAG: methyltransferase [Desulfobacteraceae bacterium]|jgi:cyclopropane fatty-acyl-phospholipid synthase-like methyltransferase